MKYLLTVEYNPNKGVVVPDNKIAGYVNKLIKLSKYSNVSVSVASEMIISQIRVTLTEGKLMKDNVIILYKMEEIILAEDCKFKYNTPEGFCDTYDKQLDKLIEFQFEKLARGNCVGTP